MVDIYSSFRVQILLSYVGVVELGIVLGQMHDPDKHLAGF